MQLLQHFMKLPQEKQYASITKIYPIFCFFKKVFILQDKVNITIDQVCV